MTYDLNLPVPVPNAPCGVESLHYPCAGLFIPHVPNAPCGVERLPPHWALGIYEVYEVPNAPCGVERGLALSSRILCRLFLMHRVELKGLVFLKT